MDFTGSGELPAAPAEVFPWVADLSTYPKWLGIVLACEPARDGEGDGGDGAVAWSVDLGARVGPFKKAKRVRMVRVACDEAGGVVRFERREQDGREHSAWVLDGRLAPSGSGSGGSTLTMRLHYGGSAWLPGLDLVLREEVRRATGRLARLVG